MTSTATMAHRVHRARHHRPSLHLVPGVLRGAARFRVGSPRRGIGQLGLRDTFAEVRYRCRITADVAAIHADSSIHTDEGPMVPPDSSTSTSGDAIPRATAAAAIQPSTGFLNPPLAHRTASATPIPTNQAMINVNQPIVAANTCQASAAGGAAASAPAAPRISAGTGSAPRAARGRRAQSGHFMPTAATTAQSTQIGVPQAEHDSAVITRGWRWHGRSSASSC